jgi:hypothetical protein
VRCDSIPTALGPAKLPPLGHRAAIRAARRNVKALRGPGPRHHRV